MLLLPWDGSVPRAPVVVRVPHADHGVQVHRAGGHLDAHHLVTLHLVDQEHSQHLEALCENHFSVESLMQNYMNL